MEAFPPAPVHHSPFVEFMILNHWKHKLYRRGGTLSTGVAGGEKIAEKHGQQNGGQCGNEFQ